MAQEADGTYAALSLLGRSCGLEYLPLPRRESRSAPLLDVPTAVAGVCRSVAAPVKLNLLSHCSPALDRADLAPLATSLVRTDVEGGAESHASRLLDLAYQTPPGADPLGRRAASMLERQAAAADLTYQAEAEAEADTPAGAMLPDLEDTYISMEPTCTATTQMIAGVPALSLSTTVMSRQRFEDARAMTDPLFWSQCEPQSLFFKEMTMLPPGPTALPYPDQGWSGRILEIVDFSYGHDPSGEAEMATELDFVVFETKSAAGCTYDLHRSRSGDILVDRGFVMVEDLEGDWRRTTTLKQVYFRTRSNPGDVCRFWSLAQGMVSTSCAASRRPPEGA